MPYLDGIQHVTVGGETGRNARVCNYEWVLKIRETCVIANKTFWFKNSGSFFEKDGVIKKINPFDQTTLAKSFNIDISEGKRLF